MCEVGEGQLRGGVGAWQTRHQSRLRLYLTLALLSYTDPGKPRESSPTKAITALTPRIILITMESITEKLPAALSLNNNEYDIIKEGSPSSASSPPITNLKELVHEHNDVDRFLPADLEDHAADDEHPTCMPSEMDDEDVRVAMVRKPFLSSGIAEVVLFPLQRLRGQFHLPQNRKQI